MTHHESKLDRGDRLQKELVQFLLGNSYYLLDPDLVSPELQMLVRTVRQVRQLMASDGWEAKVTGKRSAADIAKFDLLFINTVDGRYFGIDLTVDEALKHTLSHSQMCTMYVLRITTNEDDRPDVETKQSFCEMLLELMQLPSILNMNDTPFPSLRADLTWGQKAEELETFMNRVNAKAAALEAQNEIDPGNGVSLRDAMLLREYGKDLLRLLAFTKREHQVSTNQDLIDQQVHFGHFCARAVSQAARLCLNPQNQPGYRPKQLTHIGSYDLKRDELLLWSTASAVFLKVRNIKPKAIQALHTVSGKARHTNDDFFARKRLLIADGGKAVIEALIGIINCTPGGELLGPSFPAPKLEMSSAGGAKPS